MKKAIIKSGQTWADAAIEYFGTVEAVVELAAVNGASCSDDPPAGQEIWLPDKIWDARVQRYCQDQGIAPATARDESGKRPSVFSEEFNDIYL